MSTQSLDAYLTKRPSPIDSAPGLARLHGVDPKTVTARLRSLGYERQPNGSWFYSPLTSQTPSLVFHDPYALLVTALSNNYLLTVDPKLLTSTSVQISDSELITTSQTVAAKLVRFINTLPDSDLEELAHALVQIGLTIAQSCDTLPFRAQLTAKGFQPLDPSSTSTKAD